MDLIGNLLEGQHTIHQIFDLVRFSLLGKTGSDKNRLRAGVLILDAHAVRLHGGHDLGKCRQRFGIVFLDQQVDGVAAGGNNDILLAFFNELLVLLFNHGCADSRLLHC